MENTTTPAGFDSLGVAAPLLAILNKQGITVPSPIQNQAIPVALEGNDVIGIAQTGTGKTLAFGLPTLQRLASTDGIALILLPTRELAIQVDENLRPMCDLLRMRTAVLIGGASMYVQKQVLQKKPRIIIATPGRLIDHLEHRAVNLDKVKVLILDEADRMLDMGFSPQINRILMVTPLDRQTLLFSATMPDDIVKIARDHMKTPTRIEVAAAGTAAETVEQEILFLHREDKNVALDAILKKERGSVLVFSRTKHGATKIAKTVQTLGHTVDEIHSDRSLAQRRRALEGFKTGRVRVLVATDIAARGIDVKNIALVVNYDLPDATEDYVHRIGRTGRAGAQGKAISFAMPDQKRDVRDIERLIKKAIALAESPAGVKSTGITGADYANASGGSSGKRFHHRDSNFGYGAAGRPYDNSYRGNARPQNRAFIPNNLKTPLGSAMPKVVRPYAGKKEGGYVSTPRTFSDKPRSFGDKPKAFGDRAPRSFGDKPRTFGDKPRAFGDKPRSFGGARGPHSFAEKPRTFGDRPRVARKFGSASRAPGARPTGGRPAGTRPSSAPRRPGGPRPARRPSF